MDKTAIQFIDLSAQRRRIGSRIDRAMNRVLEHGRFILGPEVSELEARLAAFSGARHCITCANGTDALELSLYAMEIGPGDAVIVPAFSFVATVEAVARVGATPVFADIDAQTFNIDPESAEAAIQAAKALGLAPRCIIPVDLYGQPADYAAIDRLAAAHGLKVLADAAQSFGATWRGRRVGALADFTTTSFYPAKPLGCYGDGGAIFTDDAERAALLRTLRCHGQDDAAGGFTRVGRNSRLDTIQAAVLLEKLAVFEDEIAARNAAADRYAERLPSEVVAPKIGADVQSVWAQYTVKAPGDRDKLAAACRQAGVPIAVHYATPLHWAPAYRDFPTAAPRLKVAEALSRSVMSLPMHADLDEATQDRVAEALRAALGARVLDASHAQN